MSRSPRLLRSLFVLLVALPTPTWAGDLYLQLSGAATTLAGELSDQTTRSSRIAADLDEDIGFGTELGFEGRAGLILLGNRFSVGGAIFNHEADASANRFGFFGTEFEPGSQFVSGLRWIEAEYGFSPIPLPMARIELIGGVRRYHYEGMAEGNKRFGDVVVPASEELAVTGLVPHVGVGLDLKPFDAVRLRGSVKAMFVGLATTDGNTLDIEASAGFRLGRYTEVGAGVRRLKLFVGLDDDATTVDAEITGVTVYLRFGL